MRGKLFSKICDPKTLWQAWVRVKNKGSSGGIDGMTVESFETNLDRNIKEISELLQTGRYVPEPTKRVSIPKTDKPGEKRSIALPIVKDKIVQEAVRSTE